MWRILGLTAAVIAVVSLVIGGFTFNQAVREELSLSSDLQYRTRVLADSLQDSIEPSLAARDATTTQKIVDRISKNERIEALGVFDSLGAPIALSRSFPIDIGKDQSLSAALDKDLPIGAFYRAASTSTYVFIEPLHTGNRVVGALVLAQNANYIDTSIQRIWRDNLTRLVTQIILFSIAIFILVQWVFLKPLQRIAETMRKIRRGEGAPEDIEQPQLFRSLIAEITKTTTSLRQARAVASEEARMRLEQIDSPWTSERLKEFIKSSLR